MALWDQNLNKDPSQDPNWLQRYFADMMRGNRGQQNPKGVGYREAQAGGGMGDPMLDAAVSDAVQEASPPMEEVVAYGQQQTPPQMPGAPQATPPNMGAPPGLPGAMMGQGGPPGGAGAGAGGAMAPTAGPAVAAKAGAGPPPSIYEGMSEEQLSQMAGMGDLDRQLSRAESMRDQERLKGQYVNQGRTYVADSPIAHAVRGWGIYKGKKDAARLGGEQTAGRRTFIDLLRNRGRPPIDDSVDRFQEL